MKNKESASKIYLNYLIALSPLIIYGFYKNGIILYQKEYHNLFKCLTILFIPLICFFIALIIDYLFTRFNKKNPSRNSFLPLYALIICCTVSPNINLWLLPVFLIPILVIIKCFEKIRIIKFNEIALTRIFLIVSLILISNISYLNIYEKNTPQALEFLDIFLGRGYGGIFTTNIFFILIAYLFLSRSLIYKKEIPLYMLIVYGVLTLLFACFFGNTLNVWSNIFNSMVFFGAVFIAPEILSSPYTKKGKICYGIILGILTFLTVNFINNYEGVFIAIFITSLTVKFLDNFFALK